MGWRQLAGYLKLEVSFVEYSLFYRALLQKRPRILRGLLIEATPYTDKQTKVKRTRGLFCNVLQCGAVCVLCCSE